MIRGLFAQQGCDVYCRYDKINGYRNLQKISGLLSTPCLIFYSTLVQTCAVVADIKSDMKFLNAPILSLVTVL